MADYTTTREILDDGQWNIPNPYHSESLHLWLLNKGLEIAKVQTSGSSVEIGFREGIMIESEILDAAIEEYKSIEFDLAAYKIEQAELISEQVKDYIYSKYEPKRQETFNAMMTLAIAQGLNNRFQYVAQIWSWAVKVMEYYYSIEDAITAASDKASVDLIVNTPLDFSDFEAGSGVVGKEDPVVTIRQALTINN